jgi:acyl-CoA thioesterase
MQTKGRFYIFSKMVSYTFPQNSLEDLESWPPLFQPRPNTIKTSLYRRSISENPIEYHKSRMNIEKEKKKYFAMKERKELPQLIPNPNHKSFLESIKKGKLSDLDSNDNKKIALEAGVAAKIPGKKFDSNNFKGENPRLLADSHDTWNETSSQIKPDLVLIPESVACIEENTDIDGLSCDPIIQPCNSKKINDSK